MQGLKTGDLKRAPEEKFYRTTKTDGSHEAPGGVEHADKVTKPQEISSAQAERPIGASSGEILESKGREPKGATNINMEAKKAAEEREEHRGIGLGYHTRYTKRVNSHEAPDRKTPADSDTKLSVNSSAQAERLIGASAGKILAARGTEPKGATRNNRESKKEAK